MNKIKLGLIGLGYIGKVHLMNTLHLENAELKAVSDASKKALDLAKRNGVANTYTDYKKLLDDKDVDAVIIALPTHLHAKCAIEAAERGKDIFLEKPLARNVSEGKEIISKIRTYGVKLMVGYPLRFSLVFQNLREKILDGELGEVQVAMANNISSGPFFHRAESNIPHPVPEWWFKRELTGGGALLDLGSHMINLLRWYFGEVTNAQSHIGYRFNMENEDSAICLLTFKRGLIGIVNVGWFSEKAQTNVEVWGTADHAVVNAYSPNRIRTLSQLLLRRTPSYYVPFLSEIQYFVHCIQNDLSPRFSAEDALKDLETIDLAYKNRMNLTLDQL